MSDDALETVGLALQRHRLAARAVALVALMLATAYAVNALWATALANVVAGLLIVFAGAFTFIALIVGASMGIHRLRHGQTA